MIKGLHLNLIGSHTTNILLITQIKTILLQYIQHKLEVTSSKAKLQFKLKLWDQIKLLPLQFQ